MALAQVEMTEKATKVGKNVGYLAVGGAIGYAGLLAITAGVILLLSYVIPAWLAAIIVGGAIGIASYLMISSGLAALRNMDLTPNATVKTIKEDARWLKNQVT